MFQTTDTAPKKATLTKGATVQPATTRPVKSASSAGVASPEKRYRMIAEAAYYIAQRRGFAPGSELADWLAAEAEIDTILPKRKE